MGDGFSYLMVSFFPAINRTNKQETPRDFFIAALFT